MAKKKSGKLEPSDFIPQSRASTSAARIGASILAGQSRGLNCTGITHYPDGSFTIEFDWSEPPKVKQRDLQEWLVD